MIEEEDLESRNKNIFNAIFLIAVFALTLWSIFSGEDMGRVLSYVSTVNPWYLITGIVCVVTFIWGESIIIYYLMRTLGYKVRARRCYLYSFVGFFFSCITPSASGGQPAQIYYMNKDKISIPVSTLVLMIVTITYKMVLVLLGIAVLLIRPPQVMKYLEPEMGWCYLGIFLNVVCVAGMLVLAFHPSLAKKMITGGLRILERIHIVKKIPARMERLEQSMDKYNAAALYFRSHMKVVANVLLITFVQRMLLFFITWLTYRGFGLKEISMPVIVMLQGMISVCVDMLPLPGGMGISEKLFLGIFIPVFGKALTLPAMIVSRGISYYSQLLISAVMTVYANFIIGKKNVLDKG